jgi:uncharacterized protein (DUF927 family)
VRVVDIPAERSLGTAFDDSEGFNPVDFVAAVKRETSANYGTAGPAFVAALIDDKVDRTQLHDRVESFVRSVIAGAHGQAERVAERLGVVAAAGELAAAFGIVPWPQGAPTEAAKWAFTQWLTKRGGMKPAEERQAIRQVRHFIEAYGDSRFDSVADPRGGGDPTVDLDRRAVVIRAGYRKGDGVHRRWLVFPEVWRSEVCEGLDPEATAKTLANLGMLERSEGQHLAKQVKIQGVKYRFYVLTPVLLESDA